MKTVACLALALSSLTAAATLCESGKHQSPVDIQNAVQRPLPALEFDYRAAPLRIADDGYTARVRFDKGSTLRIGKERYTLQQFHFHTPGGDKIGGEEFPMAAHLLHKSQSGQLLALVVLFRTGAENPLLAEVLPRIPAHKDGDHAHPDVLVSAAALLPAWRSYYRYSGSVTAAPCTEGVEWVVMKQAVELSTAQLATWRKRYADNARAVQPLNGRTVQASP
jgi:carbonic anhydrase